MLVVTLMAVGCEGLNEGVNDNPNDITIDAIEARGFLTGAQLANIQVQVAHLQRISAMWTRQLVGYQSSYLSLDQHNITTAESNSTWNRAYQSLLTQVRTMRLKSLNDPQLTAIAKIVEAHAFGTMASLFGDIPYTEAAIPGITAPGFDEQLDVYAALHVLLDDAIADLENLEQGLVIPEDIYYAGDVTKWIESAWTLKARMYLQARDYQGAFDAAENGISSPENSMKFIPGDDSNTENKNLFWQLAAGSRAGDIGNQKNDELSYLLIMMTDTSSLTRNHGKTKEAARLSFYRIEDSQADANQGVAAALQPMPLVTYEENQLILAESGTRVNGFSSGLEYLNELREFLESGDAFVAVDPEAELVYVALDEDDFAEDGVENRDGIDPTRALLREIIEERYVTGFGTWMPFDDSRRLRDREDDILVPFPINPNGGPCHPQRFLYAANELDANTSAPADPGLCTKTQVNN